MTATRVLELMADIHQDDRLLFIRYVIESLGKSMPGSDTLHTRWADRVANTLRARTAREYSAEQIAKTYESLCDYYGEPWDPPSAAAAREVSYDLVAQVGDYKRVPFINLGYHFSPDDKHELKLREDDEEFRCDINLYYHLVRLLDDPEAISGAHVVEIGSGRGGGASFLARYLNPASYTAVDGSAGQISRCVDAYQSISHLQFVRGNALSIPLEDCCADFVVNVESSHCYSSLDRFFSEVRRILRPGGKFLFTDVVYKGRLLDYLDAMDRDFRVLKRCDVTANVVECIAMHGPAIGARHFREGSFGADLTPFSGNALINVARVFLPMHVTGQHATVNGVGVEDSMYGSLTSGPGLYLSAVGEKRGT